MITLPTNALYIYSLDQIFDLASQAGFKGVELGLRDKGDTGYASSWDADYINSLIKRYKVSVNTIHVNFGFEDDQSDWKQIVKLKNEVGANYIICHVPREGQLEYYTWFMDHIDDKNIIWENIHITKKKPEPMINHWEMTNFNQICFDIAHAERSGGICRSDDHSNVKQYHMSFWDGTDDHMSLAGKSKYIKGLPLNKKADYCLEICPKAYTLKNVKKVLKDNKKILKNI